MPARPAARPGGHTSSDGLLGFIVIAWATTWLLSLPLVASRISGAPVQPYMVAMAGMSAFGPTFAAFAMAHRRGGIGSIFVRSRASLWWLPVALLTPFALHLGAKLLEVAFGGTIERWIWLPQASAQVAALFVFPVGEEIGWRGFAHARLMQRFGPVLGPLLTGLIWGIWHLFYVITPSGDIEFLRFGLMLLELMCWGLIVAWFFERTQRSLSVAIAIHAGAHLDNSAQIPMDAWRLNALMLLILAVAALFAARALQKASAPTLRNSVRAI